MKILKKILLWLVIVIAVISVAAQFLPAKWTVTRTVVVNAQPASIYPLLVNIKNWQQWNAFSTKDPAIEHAYPTVDAGPGAKDFWKSKKFGDGNATITQADPATGIEFELRFDRMPNAVSPAEMKFSPVNGGTQITYTVSGKHGHNPAHRIFGLFMDKFLGPMFDESLANVKRLAEATPAAPAQIAPAAPAVP